MGFRTYILRMSMNPSKCYTTLTYLSFEKFNFIVHGTHILLACLFWNNQSCDVQLTVSLLTAKDGTCLNLNRCIVIWDLQEFSNDFNGTYNCPHAWHWGKSALSLEIWCWDSIGRCCWCSCPAIAILLTIRWLTTIRGLTTIRRGSIIILRFR